MKKTAALSLLFLLAFAFPAAHAQTAKDSTALILTAQDTVVPEKGRKEKSPKVAGLLSIIPGGGQIYNGKIWKVPIVYGILGASGYWLYSNHNNYIYYRDENRLRLNGKTEGLKPELANMTTSNVASYESYYRRYQELGTFLFAICYGLNIVDAMVDAHFSTYDVSENLTVSARPFVPDRLQLPGQGTSALGLSLTFQWK